MFNFIKKRWFFILLIVLFIAFVVYKFNSPSDSTKDKESFTVKKQNVKEILSLSGEIDADEKVSDNCHS